MVPVGTRPSSCGGTRCAAYGYVNGSALNHSDQTGLAPQEIFAAPIQDWLDLTQDIANSTTDDLPDVIPEPVGDTAPVPQPVDNAGAIPDTQQGEWQRYHDVCDEPPPPTNTLCDKKRWLLNQARLCKKLREDYTNKYFNGKYDPGHQTYMDNLDKRIQKLENWIARFCSQCPQTA